MTNSSPWYRWPIEIDGLPVKNGDFPWRTVSHNQRVELCDIYHKASKSPRPHHVFFAPQQRHRALCCDGEGFGPPGLLFGGQCFCQASDPRLKTEVLKGTPS